jgi:hypothetical protein
LGPCGRTSIHRKIPRGEENLEYSLSSQGIRKIRKIRKKMKREEKKGKRGKS